MRRLFLTALVFLSAPSCVFADRTPLLTVDGPWKFCLVNEAAPAAACPAFKDPLNSSALPSDFSDYATITIPHDFVVAGKHSPNASVSHGFLPFTKGWYRTLVELPEMDEQLRVDSDLWLRFEGVMRVSHVYVNKRYMKTYSDGYTPFTVDLSGFLSQSSAKTLEIVVAVDSAADTSWWYDGGGIYRHVNMFLAKKAVRIAEYGVYLPASVDTSSSPIYVDEATGQYRSDTAFMDGVTVELQIDAGAKEMITKTKRVGKLCYQIVGGPLAPLPTTAQCMTIESSALTGERVQTFEFPKGAPFRAALWDVDSPSIYIATVSLYVFDAHTDRMVLLDSVNETFGIRKFAWTNDGGFFLNDRQLKVKGFCNHQDFAGVGIAIPDDLQAFRVHMLKEMGSNAWRTSHNPVTLALLDETDKQGLLVWDENHINIADDTHMKEQSKLVLRDRNRASVFMWSVCNEVLCRGFDAVASKKHAALIHQLDPRGQRVVSSAYNGAYVGQDLDSSGDRAFLETMDVIGINYHVNLYRKRKANAPFNSRPMIISEAASDYSTRGIYVTNRSKKYVDSYDDQFPSWGSTSQASWCQVVENNFLAGQFVWTAFDYKGEPTPYNEWPSINSHFGVIDLAGFPKDNFFYYQAQFRDPKKKQYVAKIVPGVWNVEAFEGKEEMDVWVYTNAHKVQLFAMNGSQQVDLGVRDFSPPNSRCRHLEYKAVSVKQFESLLLQAFDEDDGTVATDVLQRSETKPATMEIQQDWPLSSRRVNETILLVVRLVDSKNVPVLFGENVPLTVKVTNARILGLGNGDPTDWRSSDKPVNDTFGARSTFNGLMRIVLAAGADATKPIEVMVEAAADKKIAPVTILLPLVKAEQEVVEFGLFQRLPSQLKSEDVIFA